MKRLRFVALVLLLVAAAGVVSAQDGLDSSSITFNGVSFTYDAALGQGVWASHYAGTPADAIPGPGMPIPPGESFVLTGTATFPGEALFGTDGVNVFPVAGFEQYGADSPVNQELMALQTLLDERPDLAGVTSLPYLPLATGGFAFIARAEYIETDTLSGVRYLTDVRNDVSPTLDGQVRYVFQGLTNDGQSMVSVRYNLFTGVLPTQPDPNLDYDAFSANYEQYTADLAAQLNTLDAETFMPSLTALDALVKSIRVDGM
jgi:hypothetical protein